jgi:hypothetical protein
MRFASCATLKPSECFDGCTLSGRSLRDASGREASAAAARVAASLLSRQERLGARRSEFSREGGRQ